MENVKYTEKDIQRFWSKVAITANPDKCWEWTRALATGGYGSFYDRNIGRNAIASRVAWEMTYGEIPPGMKALHKCDNPCCCNPNHIFIGTQKDNMQDMVRKGRKHRPLYMGGKTGLE